MILYSSVFTNYSGTFPNILAQNVSAPGSGDGTEFIAALVNDIWGLHQAALAYVGIIPNGVTEGAGSTPTLGVNSQVMQALAKGFAVGPGIGVTYWKNGTPAANGDRVLLLQGQVIPAASYPLLCAACYVGDANNATAAAFYYTSDSGGTTRSTTSKTYFVLPDTRGKVLKGVGSTTINGRGKTGPLSIGSIVEDSMQGHWHSGLYITSGAIQYAAASNQNTGGSLWGMLSGSPGLNLEVRTATTDGSAIAPRISTQTQDCSIGTNFGITY